MSDPLADLLAQMSEALDNWDPFPPAWWGDEARWLRANRDRVLEALGGKPDAIVSDFVSDRKWAEWLFPLEEDQ